MRTPGIRTRETSFDESYFERKARELVVADDEIEAWELDRRDLSDFVDSTDGLDLDSARIDSTAIDQLSKAQHLDRVQRQ